jgi:O-succinylbenzoic acid--CoA ligase
MERIELARILRASGFVAEPLRGVSVVDERDPAAFMGAFSKAVSESERVFLADPAWGQRERSALSKLTGMAPESPGRGWLMIPSGGTSGELKFARHDEGTISAAVRGFCGHFGVERVNNVGVLPLHHVSGFMAWMRAALTGGQYLPWDWKKLEAGEFPVVTTSTGPRGARREGWYLSLVPTQLQRLLSWDRNADAVKWLRAFDAVFLGGGPAWPELLAAAADAAIPISLVYGMTETAAMVAAQHPEEFLAGDRSSGSAMPHTRIELTAAGLVRVSGESVFRRYHPDWSDSREITTEDLGSIDEKGRLRIVGRSDAVIITGGKKVDPAEVEAALLATGEFSDIAVVGLPDPEWGQAVTACFPEGGRAPDLARAAAGLIALAAFKRPRRFVSIADWPRNAQGKLNRAELVRRAVSPH